MIEYDYSLKQLKSIISVSTGESTPDMLLRGCNLVNTFSGEVYKTNIAIHDKYIAGIGPEYTEAKFVLDLEGYFVSPGFIDAHIHIESTMLSPEEYAKAVIRHGTTSVISDPHEIANVMGMNGIKYLLNAASDLPLKIFIMTSSSVPSTPLETSGKCLSASDIAQIMEMHNVIGLAEMMNVPGILSKDSDYLEKLLLARKNMLAIDGHSPGLKGKKLNGYIAAGITTDHEIVNIDEAREKLRLGMNIMIREGSSAKNMKELIPLVSRENHSRFFLVSDDLHPVELIKNGHMDFLLKKAVALGVDPVTAIRMVTLNPAKHFRLDGLGGLTPGGFADLVVLKDLREFKVTMVISDGKVVVKNGEIITDIENRNHKPLGNSIKLKPFNAKNFEVHSQIKRTVRVIGLTKNQLITKDLRLDMEPENGLIISDIQRDILKIAVLERHNMTGNINVGFIQGLGLKQGALASSVAHDSHNIVVIGTNDQDMEYAVRRIKSIGGGFVAVRDRETVGELPLPLAGIMSDKPLIDVVKKEKRLRQVMKQLGTVIDDPFGTISFLTLPVIPALKITDKGIVDVDKFEIVPLFIT